MTKILTAVQDLENKGYEFEAAEASFDLLVRKVAKDHKPWEVEKALTLYKPWFERITYRVNIEARENNTPITEATVRLKVAGVIEHTASEGDGPVNAARRRAPQGGSSASSRDSKRCSSLTTRCGW